MKTDKLKYEVKGKCNTCGHLIKNHYLKPNGKPYWVWGKDSMGRKRKECYCRECEEYDAIYG